MVQVDNVPISRFLELPVEIFLNIAGLYDDGIVSDVLARHISAGFSKMPIDPMAIRVAVAIE